jgi:transcriptional regulator with XRE-family HTH domain
VSSHAPNQARVIPLRPATAARTAEATKPAEVRGPTEAKRPAEPREAKEPLWRHLVGDVLRKERLAQERTLKDVADEARISMPYLSEVERGRKEASSEVLAAAAQALGLGLADVLGLAGGELARLRPVARPAKSRTPGADCAVSTDDGAGTVRAGSRPGASHYGEVRLAA